MKTNEQDENNPRSYPAEDAERPGGGLQGKPRRLPGQAMGLPPAGAKPATPGCIPGFGQSVVSVSIVANSWGISTRRVRTMLAEGRLVGRQTANGTWEVIYPYQYVMGTRGPAIRQKRNLPQSSQRKSERNKEWF